MKRIRTLLPIFAAGAFLAIAWWLRPATGSTGTASSSRLYSVPLSNKPQPDSFAGTLAAAGFVAVPNTSFNSLLPPSLRAPEFESLPAFQRTGPRTSDIRFLGYRSGGAFARLYVQTSGSRQHVQAFQRETEALHAQLGR